MAKVEVAEMRSEDDESVLQFMDSMDTYLLLMDSLSSSLRQGWFDLASARHSMGASRINSSLLDLKPHSAATTLLLNHQHAGPESEKLPFSLCKWGLSESPKSCCSEEAKFEEDTLSRRKSNSPKLLHQDGSSNSDQEKMSESIESPRSESPHSGSPRTVDDQARKERLKSLSMFGMLVSPKLRAAQLSFETALETLVEIANKRAELLKAYNQVQEKMETATK